jgi:DNA-binding GntR family transcriptional regulator
MHGGKGDRIVADLRNAIQHGRYAPGQRLVEADLTEELGVSRSLLREAFRRLSVEGLVEMVRNRGALVKRLSRSEAMELFQIRMELEALAARLAARNTGSSAVKERFLTDIAEVWSDEHRISIAEYLEENERFHSAVFRASGNGQLQLLNRQLQLSLIMVQIANRLTLTETRHSIGEHRAIATAIASGDESAADAAARAHLERAREFVKSMPNEVFRKRGSDQP